MSEWNVFYPLDKNKYYSQDSFGDVLTMPAAVEVTVCGVRLVFPTSYVLVTDFDDRKDTQAGGQAATAGTPNIPPPFSTYFPMQMKFLAPSSNFQCFTKEGENSVLSKV